MFPSKLVLSFSILLLISFTSVNSQGRFTTSGGVNMPRAMSPEFFVQAGAGNELSERVFFGASVAITKLEQRPKLLLPISANIIYSFVNEGGWYPVLVLEPGFGYYSEKLVVDGREERISGGFCFFAGAGVEHILDNEGRLSFALGLSRFTITDLSGTAQHRRISIRMGLRL